MTILSKYLDKEKGRATRLAAKLKMGHSQLSQLKTGFRPIPIDRMRDIERATEGVLRFEDMLAETIKAKAKKRKANRAARLTQ